MCGRPSNEIDRKKIMNSRPGEALDLGMVRDLTLPHLDAAHNLARWLLGNDQDAADLVHTAFLRAARYVHTYAGGNARAWWLAIVRNCCLATMAARNKQEVSLENLTESQLPHTEHTHLEDQVHLSQCAGAIAQHFEQLPLQLREILVLREIEDCSYREIADILSVPIGTVMSRLARAREALKQRLLAQSPRNSSNAL
jgi:RNA polymerase sigma-70 factor (ECF subfamily)